MKLFQIEDLLLKGSNSVANDEKDQLLLVDKRNLARGDYGSVSAESAEAIAGLMNKLTSIVEQCESRLLAPVSRQAQLRTKWQTLAVVIGRYCFAVFSAFLIVSTMTLLIPM